MADLKPVLWIFVWLGVSGSLAFAQQYSNHNGEIPDDPTKCSKDAQGMVYFAVGRRVFRACP